MLPNQLKEKKSKQEGEVMLNYRLCCSQIGLSRELTRDSLPLSPASAAPLIFCDRQQLQDFFRLESLRCINQ